MTPPRLTIIVAIALIALSLFASAISANELPPAATPVVIPTATLMPKNDPLFRRWLPIVLDGAL